MKKLAGLRSQMQSARAHSLAWVNRRRLRRALEPLLQRGSIPIFFIFTPDIVHLAPYCIPSNSERFEPVLILNSVSSDDRAWLESIHSRRLTVQLKVSISGNPHSVLAHGTVLDYLFNVINSPFCIQDPDCFVIDAAFWKQVQLDFAKDFAAGPFIKRPTHHNHVLPDTFFTFFNTHYFRQVCHKYAISASSTANLGPLAMAAIQRIGYGPGEYPEQFKGCFDTLQAFWLLALAEGRRFHEIPGAGKSVFHIGGTSYLHRSDIDVSHWDWWPLSVMYFNLRLLERPAGTRFRARFKALISKFGSADLLLLQFPEYCESERFLQLQVLLRSIESDEHIRANSS